MKTADAEMIIAAIIIFLRKHFRRLFLHPCAMKSLGFHIMMKVRHDLRSDIEELGNHSLR